jgi:hypothetical protein
MSFIDDMAQWANCTECGRPRERRALNADGVCPWCLLTVIKVPPNPLLEEQ